MTSEPRDHVLAEARIERQPVLRPGPYGIQFEGQAKIRVSGGSLGPTIMVNTIEEVEQTIDLEMRPDHARWLAALLIEAADYYDSDAT